MDKSVEMRDDMLNKWESYVLYHKPEELKDFWVEFYKEKPQSKVLFLLGKGFDPRMNNVLELLLSSVSGLSIDCIAFDFPDGDDDHKEKKKLYKLNVQHLKDLQKQYGFEVKDVPVDSNLIWDKRISKMSLEVLNMDFSIYNDIILDASSLPRSFYFNIAKALYRKLKDDKSKNLFFAVSENWEIDEKIKKNISNESIEPLVGFKAMSNRESVLDRVNILIPLMGEHNLAILNRIYNHFQPSDMFPVLPFPSKNPRRSDNLMQEYHEFFTDHHLTSAQNFTYADEQNPFELYRKILNLMKGHRDTLQPISDHVCFGIALLTSKLLSMGALLVGIEHNDCVAIYNVSTTSYEIDDATEFEQLNKDSEPFLLWITGEAYNEN